MKVVFVCHYFPPHDNVGVRRVSFWANYLSNQGVDVVVITTKKRNSNNIYQAINKNIKVYEYDLFTTNIIVERSKEQIIVESSSNENLSFVKKALIQFKRKIINRYLGQLFDPRLPGALGFIIQSKIGFHKDLGDFFKNGKDISIISTVPPWPSHLIGVHLAKKYGAKLYADYRDPFSNNHIYSSLLYSLETKIDRWIANNATSVITVSPSWQTYYLNLNPSTLLLRNGYDENYFTIGNDKVINFNKNEIIVMCYFGSIEHPARMPHSLLQFLSKTKLNVKVKFYGNCSLISEYVHKNPDLKNKVELCGLLEYKAALEEMKNSEINLVAEAENGVTQSNKGLIPTKVYEYLAALRPIIAVVNKDSDMVDILNKSGLLLHSLDKKIDYEEICNNILSGNIVIKPNVEFVKSLSRQNVAKELLEYLKNNHT